MKKFKIKLTGLILICLVFIILCGCQQSSYREMTPNTDSDISTDQDRSSSDNTEIEEDKISVDVAIQKAEPSSSSTIPISYTIMFVQLEQYGSELNVRDKPSFNDNIIGKLVHGDKVEVISKQDGWASINFNGGTGFINTLYLVQEKPFELEAPSINTSPSEVYINVYKEKRTLELWSQNELMGEYNIGLGFSPTGQKEKEGDGRTPEGSYYVCVRNSNSRFYLSLGVSYPGISDAERGLASELITQSEYNNIVNSINTGGMPSWNTALGGEIMIHGSGSSSDWTAGCIAVDNSIMDILWEYCSIGTRINIFP